MFKILVIKRKKYLQHFCAARLRGQICRFFGIELKKYTRSVGMCSISKIVKKVQITPPYTVLYFLPIFTVFLI